MTDVTCKLTQGLFDYLQYKGLPTEKLTDGFSYSKAQLYNGDNRIKWEHFSTMTDRFVELIGGKEHLQDYFEYSLQTRSAWLGGFMAGAGLITSPSALYKLICLYAGPGLFTKPRSTYQMMPDGTIHITLALPSDCPPAEAWFEMCGAAFRLMPRLIGLLDSIVDIEVSPWEAKYIITPPPSYTLWARMKRAFMAVFAIQATLKEFHYQDLKLKRDYEKLLESTIELKKMKAELEDRVRYRTRELEEVNQALTKEIQARQKIEASLRESEAFFKSLFECVPAVVFLLDRDGRYIAINDWSKRYGLDPQEVIGKTIYEIAAPETATLLDQIRQKVWDTGQPLQEIVRIMTALGEKCLVTIVSPVWSPDGSMIALAGVNHDITEQVRIQEELATAKKLADEASRAKSHFLANMSHEIRTPMTAILGFANIIKKKNLVESQRDKYADRILANGHRLMELIDDILDLSRIESGRLRIEKKAIDLKKEVEDAIELIKSQAKGVELELKFAEDLPQMIRLDGLRLRQILLNIVGNAVKFTDQGTVSIELVRRISESGSPLLEMTVTDTGCGIAPEHQNLLFKLFSQADQTDARRYGGAGLGLLLSRDLARAMGGDVILAESQAGRGSTFIITIALEPAEQADGEPLQANTVQPPITPSAAEQLPLKGFCILLIEDSPDILMLTSALLNSVGAEVDAAANGASGVAKALEGDYSVLLVDIQMPGMDGFQVVAALRSKGYKKPVFALTSYAMTQDRDQCLAAGFDEHLTKPIDMDGLIAAIRKWGR
ncbi:MAG: response regulator [Oligoflexus sp.]